VCNNSVLLTPLLPLLLPSTLLPVRSIVADVVDTLAATGGNALKLVHTHDGAAAAAMALAYGTPKDRKRLVKAMKGERVEEEGGRVWRQGWWCAGPVVPPVACAGLPLMCVCILGCCRLCVADGGERVGSRCRGHRAVCG
jgi:hypothetical protein